MKIELPHSHYSYDGYKTFVEGLLLTGKVTGHNQSESLLEYTKLNLHRMYRWDKTFEPNEALARKISSIQKPLNWIAITEGWCGDAAQQLPVIEKLARLNPLITTHYILRDDNPELMNLFLTNGARSIPVWICTDENYHFLWRWGSRPKAAENMLAELKAASVADSEKKQKLHAWYAANKHVAMQQEIANLLTEFDSLNY
jgi:hypothetical protein